MRPISILVVLGMFLSSFPAQAEGPQPAPAVLNDLEGEGAGDHTETDFYLLQPGDRVTIKIYPEDEYLKGGEIEISTEGNITMPLIGKVLVGGLTVAEAERALVILIDRDYIVDPEVVIDVLKYKKQSVVILGQVVKPGTYEFPPDVTHMTLLQAISMAGGFSDIANIKKIKIMRKGNGKNEVIRANAEDIIGGKEPDVELESGDIVNVMESLF